MPTYSIIFCDKAHDPRAAGFGMNLNGGFYMLDFHSHILPCIDDGSKSVEESLALLKMLLEQGVDAVVATPHFYANSESVLDFLERRDGSMSSLRAVLPSDAPTVLCGAEVYYYPGISRMPDIERLCIDKSRLLLIEMPMSEWDENVKNELCELASCGKFTVVIAHVERYIELQSEETIHSLLESGIRLQCNAGFFFKLSTKRRALAMLEAGLVHFIGSDCHSIKARPPQIDRAYRVIAKKFGEDFLAELDAFGKLELGLGAAIQK